MNRMTQTSSVPRRELNFSCFNCVLGDLEKVCSGPVETTGQWTAGMIVQHIADAINASIDGFAVKAPLAMRLAGSMMRKRIISNRLNPGIQIPKSMEGLRPDRNVALADAAANLRAAIRRTENEKMTATHPILGRLSDQEWRQFHLRHAEMHFSFIQPQ